MSVHGLEINSEGRCSDWMKPLSTFKYCLNNRKKFLTVFTAVLLSVFLLYFVQMLIDSSFRINDRAFVEPQRYYSSITAKSRVLDAGLIRQVTTLEGVKKALPWVFHYTNFQSGIGGNIGVKVFTVKQEDMKLLMERMHLRLKEGRLPLPGTNEILLHTLVADNKRLRVGDRIGSNVRRNEVIQGERVISGLIEGESIVNFESLEYWMKKNRVSREDFSLGVILIPSEGGLERMNKALDEMQAAGVEIRTLRSVRLQNAMETESINLLLTLINIMVIAIVSICIGFISYLYFYHRRSEFGILSAMGYTGNQIIGRAFSEIAFMNAAGLAAGILMALAAGGILNLVSFIPRGQPLELWSLDYLVKAACVPLFVVLFSIIPVWRLLKELDPVTMIEGVG